MRIDAVFFATLKATTGGSATMNADRRPINKSCDRAVDDDFGVGTSETLDTSCEVQSTWAGVHTSFIRVSISGGTIRVTLRQPNGSEHCTAQVNGCVSRKQAEYILLQLGFIDHDHAVIEWGCTLISKDMYVHFVQSVDTVILQQTQAKAIDECSGVLKISFKQGMECRTDVAGDVDEANIDATCVEMVKMAYSAANALCLRIHNKPLDAMPAPVVGVCCIVQAAMSRGSMSYNGGDLQTTGAWVHKNAMQKTETVVQQNDIQVVHTLRVFGSFRSVTELVEHVGPHIPSQVEVVSAYSSGVPLSTTEMGISPQKLFVDRPAITFWMFTGDKCCYAVTLIWSNGFAVGTGMPPRNMTRIPTPPGITMHKSMARCIVSYVKSIHLREVPVRLRVVKQDVSMRPSTQAHYYAHEWTLWRAVREACVQLTEQTQFDPTEGSTQIYVRKVQYWIRTFQEDKTCGLHVMCNIISHTKSISVHQCGLMQQNLRQVPEMCVFMEMLECKGSYYYMEVELPFRVLLFAAAMPVCGEHAMELCGLGEPHMYDDGLVTIGVGHDVTYRHRKKIMDLMQFWLVPLLNKAYAYAQCFINDGVRTVQCARSLLSSAQPSPLTFDALDWRLVTIDLFECGAVVHATDDNGTAQSFSFDPLSHTVKKTCLSLAPSTPVPRDISISKLAANYAHRVAECLPIPIHSALVVDGSRSRSILDVVNCRAIVFAQQQQEEDAAGLFTVDRSAGVGALLLAMLPLSNKQWCFTRTHTFDQILHVDTLSDVLKLVLQSEVYNTQVKNMESHLRVSLCEANHHILKLCGTQASGAIHPPRPHKRDLVKMLFVCAAAFALYFEILNTMFDMVVQMNNDLDKYCDTTRQSVLLMYNALFLEREAPTHTTVPLSAYLTSSFSFGASSDGTFKMFFAVVTHKGNNKAMSDGEVDKCVLINWRCNVTKADKRKRDTSSKRDVTMATCTALILKNEKLYMPFFSGDMDSYRVDRGSESTNVTSITVCDGELHVHTASGDDLLVGDKNGRFKVRLCTEGTTTGHRRKKKEYNNVYDTMVSTFGAPITTSPNVWRVMSLDEDDLAKPIKTNLDAKTGIDFRFTPQQFTKYASRLKSAQIGASTQQLLWRDCKQVCEWMGDKNTESGYLQYITAPGNWDAAQSTNRDQKTQFYVTNNLCDALAVPTEKNKRTDLGQNSMAVNTNARRTSMYTNKQMLTVYAEDNRHFDPNMTMLNNLLQGKCESLNDILHAYEDMDSDMEHLLTILPTRLCVVLGFREQCMQMCDCLAADLSERID